MPGREPFTVACTRVALSRADRSVISCESAKLVKYSYDRLGVGRACFTALRRAWLQTKALICRGSESVPQASTCLKASAGAAPNESDFCNREHVVQRMPAHGDHGAQRAMGSRSAKSEG